MLMKKFMFLFAVVFLFSTAVIAQKDTKETKATPDFSGEWTLNLEKSDMGERGRVKSMEMSVTQTTEKISYTRKSEMEARPEGGDGGGGMRPGGGGGGMGGGRGGAGGSSQSAIFQLDGTEVKTEAVGGMGGTVKLKAKASDGKLSLKTSREFNSPNGAVQVTTNEKWELSADGKTLTIKSDMVTPRGNMFQKLVFEKTE